MAIAPSRAFELDGLRGLAALTVFFSHLAGLAPAFEASWPSHSVLHALWDGSSAVALFFVLSGYVLSLPFTSATPKSLDLRGFFIRRVVRLYPAYWFALLVSLGLRYLVLRHNNLAMFSVWAGSLWADPISALELVKHFVMVAPHINTHAIDPVVWTLVYEMKLSILFPLLIVIVQRTSRPIYALLILAAFDLVGLCFNMISVTALFVSGIYLAKYRVPIIGWASRLSTKTSVVLLVVAFVLYENASIAGGLGRFSSCITDLGALLLVILSLAFKPLSRLTTMHPCRFLGDISYSFYLLHLPILLAVISALYPRVHSLTLCAAVALLSSFALSKLVFECIECPMRGLGKRLAKRHNRPETEKSVAPSTDTSLVSET